MLVPHGEANGLQSPLVETAWGRWVWFVLALDLMETWLRVWVMEMDRLLNAWEKLVGEVERGHDFSIYDYLNDLDSRVMLRRALETNLSSEDHWSRLLRADTRYLEATTEALHIEVLKQHFDAPDAWLARVPKVLRPELKSDLEGK